MPLTNHAIRATVLAASLAIITALLTIDTRRPLRVNISNTCRVGKLANSKAPNTVIPAYSSKIRL